MELDDRIIKKHSNEIGPTALAVYVVVRMHGVMGCGLADVEKLLPMSRPTTIKAMKVLYRRKLVTRLSRKLFRCKLTKVKNFYVLLYSFHSFILKTVLNEEEKKPLTRKNKERLTNLLDNGIDNKEALARYCSWWNSKKKPIIRRFNFGLFCCDSMLNEYAISLAPRQSTHTTARASSVAKPSHSQRNLQLLRELLKDIKERKQRGEKLTAEDKDILQRAREAGILKGRGK